MNIYTGKLLQVGSRPARLPPGPRTLPIVGNMHLMPTFKPYKKFTEWGKIYGPIYSLMVGSNPLVVLQSHKVAKDLLDKRGSNYSSRPDLYIMSDVSSRGLRQLVMQYNPTWRLIHRVNHSILNAKAIKAYTPYQILESRQMLVDILDNAAEHKRHIQRFSNSVMCQMIYGFRTTTCSDPNLLSAISMFSEFCDMAVSIPARLMDCYPIFRRIPKRLLPVCRQAMDFERRCMAVHLDHWLEGKKKAQDGAALPCYCASLVQEQVAEGFSDEVAAHIAGNLIEAGSNTTSDELFGFLLAMVTHPDVQRRAQQEVDSVVGTGRLPTLEDMQALPYIRGCAKETLRWMPTTALLIPHAPLKDDVYQDYIIPAGATVFLNVWALNMDPANWPNPRVFDPSRFEHETRSEHEIATSGDPASVRHNYIFGAGRRLCPGIHIGERNMFLAMACLLWAFDMSTPDPSKIDTEDLRGGLALAPAPFECHLKPRDSHRADVMRREWRQLRTELLDPVTKQWSRVPGDLPLNACSES
ncbi:cytochrome P450 family protein [Hypoxylon sp. FL0543]|nr:cytochrome P450 family protein [Hypoxylon sp. FL0543]